MTGVRQAWLFFRVVRPVPRLTRLTFGALTCVAVAALVADAGRAAVALRPILVLQMFAVSTGFLSDARRGYFDVLFAQGAGRVAVALVYWVCAATPGLVSWLVLAGVDTALHQRDDLWSPGAVAAVVGVSVLPWAATVGQVRFAGAIGWLLLLVVVLSVLPGDHGRTLLTAGADERWWMSVAAAVLYPPRLVGAPHDTLIPAALLVGLSMASLGAVFWWLRRVDVPLDAGQ